jgi:hypothetical protein
VVFIYTMSGFARNGRANGEGGIRYWAVQSGRVGVEGGGMKDACLVAVRLSRMFRLSRFSFSVCRRTYTRFRTWQKFEIKNTLNLFPALTL